MTTRILPREEYEKLSATEIPQVLPYMRPEDVQVVVVEDDEGRVIGAWAVLRVVQLEGVWIAPSHRKRGRVAGLLKDATLALARTLAPTWAFTGAQTADVAALLETHLHAKRLPMDPYVIPLETSLCR